LGQNSDSRFISGLLYLRDLQHLRLFWLSFIRPKKSPPPIGKGQHLALKRSLSNWVIHGRGYPVKNTIQLGHGKENLWQLQGETAGNIEHLPRNTQPIKHSFSKNLMIQLRLGLENTWLEFSYWFYRNLIDNTK